MDTPQVLLEHYLKQLRLPTMLREYRQAGEQCAKEGVDLRAFLLRLVEQEMLDRERRATERRIKAAKFPVSQEPGDLRLPGDPIVEQEAGGGTGALRVDRPAGKCAGLGQLAEPGKTHIGLALGLAACQQGFRVRFTTAASLVHELIEAKDERAPAALSEESGAAGATDRGRTGICTAVENRRRNAV